MERDLVEKPMDELQGTALQYSCVTAASRGTLRKGEKRVCNFCDKTYAGGPSVIADHIMHPSGSKIAACVPKLEWLQRFNEVSAEMKRRKGPTPTGPTPGEQRTGALNATRAGQTAMDKFLKKPTIEEIEEQFMRVACKHNGAMGLADCGEFRKLLAMCCRAGHSVLEGVKVENPQLSVETRGQTYVITLCHRTKMTTKVLPALDQKLMDKVGPIVEKSAEMNGSSGGGDGWTDHCGRPMMNFVQHVPEGARFVECIDASGDTKDAKYQASFAVKCMRKSGGVHVYFVLWFDGACKPAFSHIEKEVPHVSCVVDAAHSMDLMGKNICSTKPTVTIKGVGSKPWGVTKFGNVRAAIWYAIKAVYAQEKTLSMYRAITKSAPGTEHRKFCMTRFLSNAKMVRRYKRNLRFMEQLLASSEFNTWLEGQPTKIKERWAKVKKIVHDDALNADIDLFLRVLEPVEKMVRLFDGMKGVYIGVAYEALLQPAVRDHALEPDRGPGGGGSGEDPGSLQGALEVPAQAHLHGGDDVAPGLLPAAVRQVAAGRARSRIQEAVDAARGVHARVHVWRAYDGVHGLHRSSDVGCGPAQRRHRLRGQSVGHAAAEVVAHLRLPVPEPAVGRHTRRIGQDR